MMEIVKNRGALAILPIIVIGGVCLLIVWGGRGGSSASSSVATSTGASDQANPLSGTDQASAPATPAPGDTSVADAMKTAATDTSSAPVNLPKPDGGSYAKTLLAKLTDGKVPSAEACAADLKAYKVPDHASLNLFLYVASKHRCLGLMPQGVFGQDNGKTVLTGTADAIIDIGTGETIVQCISITKGKPQEVGTTCKDAAGTTIPAETVWTVGNDTWNALTKLVNGR